MKNPSPGIPPSDLNTWRKKTGLEIDLSGLRSQVQVSGTPWPETWPDLGLSGDHGPAGQVQVSCPGLVRTPLQILICLLQILICLLQILIKNYGNSFINCLLFSLVDAESGEGSQCVELYRSTVDTTSGAIAVLSDWIHAVMSCVRVA